MGKSKDKGGEEKDAVQVKEQPADHDTTPSTASARPDADRPDYEELITRISVISKPLASKKLTKKLYKTVKKAAKSKHIRRGVKEVSKAMRKQEKGFVVLAGDVSPIDVISHLPIMCEDNEVPYCYVPSRMDLGLASQTKRPTSVVLVKSHEDYKDYYKECFSKLKEMPLPL